MENTKPWKKSFVHSDVTGDSSRFIETPTGKAIWYNDASDPEAVKELLDALNQTVTIRENMVNQVRSLLRTTASQWRKGWSELAQQNDEKARFLWTFMPQMNGSEFDTEFAEITQAQREWYETQRLAREK